MKAILAAVSLFAASAQAGTVLWSGIFNSSFTTATFDKWSWSNQIEPWQWYIHGSQSTDRYLDVSPNHKNPADTSSAQGVRTRIDGTAFWNGQNMARTEIIPQTSKNIGTGHLFYHFSLKTSSTNAPNPRFEHQIAFFESHFTELKYGLLSGASGTSDNTLRWMVGGQTQWSTPLSADTWYNFAYDIDFSAGTIGLWTSTGGDPLVQVKSGVRGSPQTNSADFHIGVLRLPNGGTDNNPEDYFWSGIYVEQAPITTSVAGPFPGQGGTNPPAQPPTTPPTNPPTTTATTTAQPQPPTTTAPSGPLQSQWGQCGGTGYSGPTTCASPFTCKAVSPPYYYQCQ